MKALLIGEYRGGKLLETTYELLAFADKLGLEKVMFLAGDGAAAPHFDGRLYLAHVDKYGEYAPEQHKQLVLAVVEKEAPDYIVLLHSSYGWDLAPRLAAALQVGQISAVVDAAEGQFELGLCNGKMRRTVTARTTRVVLTIQVGSFGVKEKSNEYPQIESIEFAIDEAPRIQFMGYEPPDNKDVDLARANVVVSAGRGVGNKDNVDLIARLAKALGGELGASRPVVDAGWVEYSRQVGMTGQTVAPKVYVACGISGAAQHLAGMTNSNFILAINNDKDAPIGEIADVLVVADLLQFVPLLIDRLETM